MLGLAYFALVLMAADHDGRDHSAQCLVQVAALTGEELDITDRAMRSAAVAKTDQLMASVAQLRADIVQLEASEEAFLETVPGLVRSGDLPPGSYAVVRESQAADRASRSAPIRALEAQTPDCDWPQ